MKGERGVYRENGESGRTSELEPIGVVDIGSNSVRLVVYEGAVRSPTPIFNEKVLCGLGRQVGSTGHLGKESVDCALEALRRFKAIARILGVKNIWAIATAACRDASDGPDFIARGERALGARIQVLSGQREAELAASGIMMGFRSPDGFAGDLGGGSLEIIEVKGEALRQSVTLPLGGLRLLDASDGRIDDAIDIADDQIGRVPWLANGRNRDFYAVGGTWRAIAKLHMERTDYPLRVMHGYTMPTEEAIDFCEEIRKAKKLSAMPGIEDVSRPAARGAAVRSAGAGAAAQEAGAERGPLLGVRHPRGPGLQPAVGGGAPQGPAASRSAPSTHACARDRPSTRASCAPGPMPCSSRRDPRRRRRSGGCAMRRACSPTSAGAPTRTIAASRA